MEVQRHAGETGGAAVSGVGDTQTARQRAQAILDYFDPDGDGSAAVPIAHQTHVAAARDVLALAEAHDEAIRLLALVTELAAATTKHEPGRGYVAITEAKAFLAEQDPALAAAGEGAE